MKQAPVFDQVVGQSHAVNTKVELRAPDDSVVGVLPVEAGTVTGNGTARLGIWSGDLTLAGLEWAPDGPGHPLSGLSGHYCSIQRAALPYGQQEAWVEVARLWVYETSVEMSRRDAALRVQLVSPAGLLERAVHDDFAAHRNDPVQKMIESVLKVNLPYTPTVLDTSTAGTLPAEYDPKDVTPIQVADELAAAVNIRVYFDALGRLVMRDTLPSIDLGTFSSARQLAVDIDVIRYTLTFGRSIFANDAVARYDWEDTAGQPKGVIGRASISSGPGAKDGPAGRLSVERQFDIDARQADADKYARAMLTSQQQAWVTSRIDAVQDPRLEPFDLVETKYLDRTLRHRVTAVQFDLTTDQMQITGRTALGST